MLESQQSPGSRLVALEFAAQVALAAATGFFVSIVLAGAALLLA
ncbi:MAG: hypothetical protein ACREUO_09840 [Burkholderiales bacterium]